MRYPAEVLSGFALVTYSHAKYCISSIFAPYSHRSDLLNRHSVLLVTRIIKCLSSINSSVTRRNELATSCFSIHYYETKKPISFRSQYFLLNKFSLLLTLKSNFYKMIGYIF
jgi:hypothetical protein